MKIQAFAEETPPELSEALRSFERQFRYPLGPDRSFRIEHDADYARFYRAIGEARCFVSTDGESVHGVLATAIRELQVPDGSERSVAYIGDLKLSPKARFGMTLPLLAAACDAWAKPKVEAAFGVVMNGTTSLPETYSGRLGIPGFEPVGHVVVLRFDCRKPPATIAIEDLHADDSTGRACYRQWSVGRYACSLGCAAERSETLPQWLVLPDNHACGFLEDTRRAKRLIDDDDVEMVSAHLSCFAFRDLSAAALLLRAAIEKAATRGFPAMFVAVAASDAELLVPAMNEVPVVAAPATVYGYLLEKDIPWNINSSEI